MRAEALLNEYVRNGSEQAFRELVAAYVNFVYGTALRSVGGDTHMAEDVAQTVFIDLARKAAMLPANVQLGGWLHRHTCFVARKALRKERRRMAREKQAVQLQTIADYTQENLSHLAAILDEVLNKLAKAEREAIILRFFEQHDFQSLGELLGSSENAARMRVSRALDKMRGLLQRRGIVLSIAGLAYVLGLKSSAAAPVWLAARVSQAALSQAHNGFGVLAIVKHACSTRLNIGLGCTAALVAGLVMLSPRGKSAAGPLIAGSAVSPAEFADLTTEEETPPPVTPVAVTPTPAPASTRPPIIAVTQPPVPAVAPVPQPPSRPAVPSSTPPAKVAATQPPPPQPVSIGLADAGSEPAQLFPPNSRRSLIAFPRRPATPPIPAAKRLAADPPSPKTLPEMIPANVDKTPRVVPVRELNAYQAAYQPVVVSGQPNPLANRSANKSRQRQPP